LFPYWVIFSIFAAGAVGTRKRASVRSWNPLLVVAGLALAVMIGFRFEVGADWFNYARIFFYTGVVDLDDALLMVDPAYALLNWVVYSADWGIWVVNIFCGSVLVWGLLLFAHQQPNPWLCIVVAIPYLVIVVGMGYTRQAVALGFILAGLANLERQSLTRFVILVICAAAFHKTAIVVLPLVALSTERNRFIVIACFAAAGFLLFTFFLERAMEVITSTYLDQEYDASGAVIRVMMNVLPAIVFLLFRKRFQLSLMEARLWRNFSYAALATVPLLLLTTSSVIVDRLAIYLIPLQLFVFARLPWAFPDRGGPNGQLALLVTIYSAMVQATWLNAAAHADHWLPYQLYPVGQEYRPDLQE
jgi:hypothetical protein